MEKQVFTLREGEEFIRLGQALKAVGAVGNGVEAKMIIADGYVTVNGQVDTRRGKKLRDGDVVHVEGIAAGLYEDTDFVVKQA